MLDDCPQVLRSPKFPRRFRHGEAEELNGIGNSFANSSFGDEPRPMLATSEHVDYLFYRLYQPRTGLSFKSR